MSDLTGRLGVALTEVAVTRLNWFFREQPILDQGVDAIVEDVDVISRAGNPAKNIGTGRLLALQIKGGDSYFREVTRDGWWFRFDGDHARRWFNLAIPMIIVLVDPDDEVCYWQRIAPDTAVKAGQGFKVEVPRTQTIAGAADVWRVLASHAAEVAPERYSNSLEHLPPSVVELVDRLHDDAPLDAALLAYHLAEGRHNAEDTVGMLKNSSTMWITRSAPTSWLAIAEYASAFECRVAAADLLERAAKHESASNAQRGRWLTSAAIQLVYVDNSRASRLTDEAARDTDADVVSVLRSVLDHPQGNASPIPLPQTLHLERESTKNSAFLQSFLALHHKHAGNIAQALRHAGRAVECEPENSVMMVLRGEIALWAALCGHNDPRLPEEGTSLLEAAIKQRRQWAGPTLDATLQLSYASMVQGRVPVALRYCLPSPDGVATPETAADPRVRRVAVVAAARLERPDLAARVARTMATDAADQIARFRAGLIDASSEQRSEWLRDDVDDAMASGDHMRAMQSATELSELGTDATDLVEPLIAASIAPKETPELFAALAQAHVDLDAALPRLRKLARTNRQAAGLLLERMQNEGRIAEALDITDMLLGLGRTPAYVMARVKFLIQLEDDRAEQAALSAVAEVDGWAEDRVLFLNFAAKCAADRLQYEEAEQHLHAVLKLPGAASPLVVWNLVGVQLEMGHLDRAAYTISTYRPLVRDQHDAERWLSAHASGHQLDAIAAAEAYELATRFDDPGLSTRLLSLIVLATNAVDSADVGVEVPSPAPRPSAVANSASTRAEEDDDQLEERRRIALPSVPAELHRKAFEALDQLLTEHGDATGVTRIGGESDDELVANLIDTLRSSREQDQILADYVERAQNSQVPIAVVAALARRGYATSLIQRSIGVLPASSPDLDEIDLDVETANAAVGKRVVVDASALLTASNPELEEDLASQFLELIVSPAVRRDIYRANADIRGAAASPGSMGFDPESEQIFLTRLSPEEYLRQLRRMEQLLRLAAASPTRPVITRSVLPALADDPHFHSWTDPLELAKAGDFALWSDDLALRRIAHQLGITAFGTPSLLIALNEKRAASAGTSERLQQVMAIAAQQTDMLAADRIVDLPLATGAVLRLGEADDWAPGAGALALSRSSWWAWSTIPLKELAAVFGAVKKYRPDALADWQVAAMLGAGRAFTDPAASSRMLCTLAIAGWELQDGADAIGAGIALAQKVARRLSLQDPICELEAIADAIDKDGDTAEHTLAAELRRRAYN